MLTHDSPNAPAKFVVEREEICALFFFGHGRRREIGRYLSIDTAAARRPPHNTKQEQGTVGQRFIQFQIDCNSRSMGASTVTLAALLVIFQTSSTSWSSPSSIFYVHSFTNVVTRRSTPSRTLQIRSRLTHSSLDIALFKRPRCLASAGTDLEESSIITTQLSSPDDDDDGNDEQTNLSTHDNNDSNPLLKKLFLGIDPTPDIIAIATIYFVEGALGLARLAQTFLLKEDLHMGPAEMSATMGILALPWTIKPLYGFLSDGFPIFGYRRRSYLVLAGMVGFLSYATLAWGSNGSASGSDVALNDMALTRTIISLLLSSASIALADVVADGIVVQKTRDAVNNGDDPAIAGGLQSLCWGSAAIGGLISAYFSGSLLETMSPRDVFGIASVLPLAVGGMSLLIEEEPVTRKYNQSEETIGNKDIAEIAESQNTTGGDMESAIQSVQTQISSIWETLRQPNIYKPILFLFLWKATPTSEGAMLYFLTNDIGFGPEFLGRVRLLTAASSLLGVWLYNQYLRRVAIKDILFWTSLISVPLGLTQLLLISHYNRELGIPDGAFIFGDDVISSILGNFLAFALRLRISSSNYLMLMHTVIRPNR